MQRNLIYLMVEFNSHKTVCMDHDSFNGLCNT